MTRFVRIAFGLILGLTCAASLMTGCQGTTQAGTQYKLMPNRELQVRLSADLATVHDRAVSVLRDEYGFDIKHEDRDSMEGIVEATTAQRDKVRVQTFREGAEMTVVQVYFGGGPFGDVGKAEQVLNSIETSVGPAATATGESNTPNNMK